MFYNKFAKALQFQIGQHEILPHLNALREILMTALTNGPEDAQADVAAILIGITQQRGLGHVVRTDCRPILANQLQYKLVTRHSLSTVHLCGHAIQQGVEEVLQVCFTHAAQELQHGLLEFSAGQVTRVVHTATRERGIAVIG